jgi:hypothetical protein
MFPAFVDLLLTVVGSNPAKNPETAPSVSGT